MKNLLSLFFAAFLLTSTATTAFAIVEREALRSLRQAQQDVKKSTINEGKSEATAKNGGNEEALEEALTLVERANNLIDSGNKGEALELLDKAYQLVIDGDEENSRQKDDLRVAISKAIVHAYAAAPVRTSGIKGEIPMVLNADVEAEINSFQTRERDFFISSYLRSANYRPAIVRDLRRAGLPEEFSWLPLVESGFKVNALSRARALGLWQFIPSTGYRYGLARDSWIDERMDPSKSTRAAINYLQDLHGLFGDWLTVLAAYNCGEGRVMRTIRRQTEQHADYFWDLYRQLPRETARYVPRFLATLHIVKNPIKYGFELPSLPETSPEYRVLKTDKPMRLEDIAKLADIDENELVELNAELRFRATPNREYSLKVPREAYPKVDSIIDKVPEWRRIERGSGGQVFTQHRVSQGETLTSIARQYGTTVSEIRRHNRANLRRGLGQGITLRIPLKTHSGVSAPIKGTHYRVVRGDTLSSISRRSGVPINTIKRLNGLQSNLLRAGQNIKIR